MFLRVQVITPPAVPLVTTDLVRQHCRIDSTYDDALLAIYIDSATSLAETYIARSLISRSLRLTWSPSTPPRLWPLVTVPAYVLPIGAEYVLSQISQQTQQLPYSPAISIDRVAYRGWDDQGDTDLVLGVDYQVDYGLEPARVRYINGIDWRIASHHVVDYTAGYGTDPEMVPVSIRHAVMLTAARAYEHRGDDDSDAMLTRAARSLLDPFRIAVLGAG